MFCCIGNNKMCGELLGKIKNLGVEIPSLIHSSTYVSSSAVIKYETIVSVKAIINTKAIVKEGCIITVGAIVDHDAVISDCCHINAGSIVASMGKVPAETKLDYGMIFR